MGLGGPKVILSRLMGFHVFFFTPISGVIILLKIGDGGPPGRDHFFSDIYERISITHRIHGTNGIFTYIYHELKPFM